MFYINPRVIDSCRDFAIKLIEYRRLHGRRQGCWNRSVNHVNVGEIVDIIYRTAFSELLNIKAVAVISSFHSWLTMWINPAILKWWKNIFQ